jgi:hypothetical protein
MSLMQTFTAVAQCRRLDSGFSAMAAQGKGTVREAGAIAFLC